MEQAMSSQQLWISSDMQMSALTGGSHANTSTLLSREAYETVRWRANRARLAHLRSLLPATSVRNKAFAIMAIFGIAASSLLGAGTSRPIEATTSQLERLANRVERARTVHPDTAERLARMLARPEYDCARTTCSEALQARNSTARRRLESLIAMKTRSDAIAASGDQVIAAGPVGLVAPR
jgi:hypothetical protein